MRTRLTMVVLFGGLAGLTRAEDYKPGDQVVVIADAQLNVKGNLGNVWPGLVLKVAHIGSGSRSDRSVFPSGKALATTGNHGTAGEPLGSLRWI